MYCLSGARSLSFDHASSPRLRAPLATRRLARSERAVAVSDVEQVHGLPCPCLEHVFSIGPCCFTLRAFVLRFDWFSAIRQYTCFNVEHDSTSVVELYNSICCVWLFCSEGACEVNSKRDRSQVVRDLKVYLKWNQSELDLATHPLPQTFIWTHPGSASAIFSIFWICQVQLQHFSICTPVTLPSEHLFLSSC